MKRFLIILFLFPLLPISSIGQNPTTDKNWSLFFYDDFTNPASFDSLYNPRIYVNSLIHGDCKYGCTQELQCYTKNNIEYSNGIIQLVAKKEKYTDVIYITKNNDDILKDGKPNKRDFNYTSGAFMTKNRFSYGYYEMKCKIPKGKGFWPAFWLFHDPGCNNGREIDILEPNGVASILANKYSTSIHYTYKKDSICKAGSNGQPIIGFPDLSSDYHLYAVEWTPNRILFYFDNHLIHSIEGKYVPSNPMHIITNLAIDPWYSPNKKNFISKSFDIDYIKMYKLKMDTMSSDLHLNGSNFDFSTFDFSVKKSISIENMQLNGSDTISLRANDYIEFSKNIDIPIGTTFYANTVKKH